MVTEAHLTIPHILYTPPFRICIHQSMESIMSKSISVILSLLSANTFFHGVCQANPAQQNSSSYTEVHNSPYYWMHLWEERLRDEYSHVQNNMSTSAQYNVIKKQLSSVFQKQYSHELKYAAYEAIRTLREEGILSKADEDEYASFIINVEIKLHEQG